MAKKLNEKKSKKDKKNPTLKRPSGENQDSERLQEQEVEGLEEDVVPHHDDERLWDLADALFDEPHDVGEVLLADGDVSSVEVSGLQPGEEEFTGTHVVAVGPQLHQRDVQPLQ